MNHSTCYFCTPLGGSLNSARAPKPASSTLEGQPSPRVTLPDFAYPTSSQCFVFFFSVICFHCHLPPPFILPRTLSKVISSPGGTMAHCPVSRPPSCSLACVSRTTHPGTCPPLGTPAQPEHGSPPSPDPTALPSEPPLFQRGGGGGSGFGDPPVLCEKLLTV